MPGAVALTTIAVTPVLLALVALDLSDASVRSWFDAHAFTSAVITLILVLLITVLSSTASWRGAASASAGC
jgi:hypothetical protein